MKTPSLIAGAAIALAAALPVHAQVQPSPFCVPAGTASPGAASLPGNPCPPGYVPSAQAGARTLPPGSTDLGGSTAAGSVPMPGGSASGATAPGMTGNVTGTPGAAGSITGSPAAPAGTTGLGR